MVSNDESIATTIRAKITDATITTMAELCNEAKEGHETFSTSSLYEFLMYPILTFFIFSSRSRGIRTPINGFGDRYSTLELCSYKWEWRTTPLYLVFENYSITFNT